MLCYENIVKYLNKYFDFSDANKYRQLSAFCLDKEIKYCDFEVAVSLFNLHNFIDSDALYEEFCETKQLLHSYMKMETEVVQKWVNFFCEVNVSKVPNIAKVIGFIFSIPGSNAYVERIFSLMKFKWSDVRNKCSVDLIKAELQVFLNFNQSCREFITENQNNVKLLKAVKSSGKYMCQ